MDKDYDLEADWEKHQVEKDKVFTDHMNGMIENFTREGWSARGVSDTRHTFEELYYHRMMLFLTIQNAYPLQSWKSKKDYDGSMLDNSFIVGIETPKGQYSYKYNLKYWDIFEKIGEIECAPEYDEDRAEDIKRLLSLNVLDNNLGSVLPIEDQNKIEMACIKYPLGSKQMVAISVLSGELLLRGINVEHLLKERLEVDGIHEEG